MMGMEGGGWQPLPDPRIDALGALIAEHHRDLLRVALAISGSRRIAAEAAEWTWRSVAARPTELRRPSSTRALLLRLVTAEARRRLRGGPLARLRRRLRPPPVEPPVEGADAPLLEVLRGLDADDRLMLGLRYGAGRTSEEIAAQLGLVGAGVRTHLTELRDRLSGELQVTDPYQPQAVLTETELDRRLAARLTREWDRGAELTDPRNVARRVLDRPGRRRPRIRRPVAIGMAVVVMLAGGATAIAMLPAGDASASRAPTPSPGTLVPIAGWSERQIGSGETRLEVIGWSPDGSRVAVLRAGLDQIDIYDRAGALLRTVSGAQAAWLGSSQLIVVSSGGAFGTGSGTVFARSVGDAPDSLVDTPPAGGLVGSTGAVAITDATDGGSTFRLIRDGAVTDPIQGIPLAWSRDGRRLAFISTAFVAPGALHLLDAATMEVHAVGAVTVSPGLTLFDPSGRHLLVCAPPETGAVGCDLALVDLDEASIQRSSLPGSGAVAAWSRSGSLLVQSRGLLARWRPGDAPVALRWQPDRGFTGVLIAAGGDALVLGLSTGPQAASRPAGDEPAPIVLPGHSVPRGAAMSPDGSRIVVARRIPGGDYRLYLATVPPLEVAPSAGPSASATPTGVPASVTPVHGQEIVQLPDSVSYLENAENVVAVWGPRAYRMTYDAEIPTIDLVDVTSGEPTAIVLGLADGERPQLVATDGDSLLVLVSRRVGPVGGGNEECSTELTHPQQWRIITAPVDARGYPSEPFRTFASGTATRVTKLGDGWCPETMLPQVAFDAGVVALSEEAPTASNRWASRISLRRLADGALVRSVSAAEPVIFLTASGGAIAWREASDVAASGSAWHAYVSIADGSARTELPLPGAESPFDPSFELDGDRIVYTLPAPNLSRSSVWSMPVVGGTATQISPPGASCRGVAGTAELTVMFCQLANEESYAVLWSPGQGTRLIDAPGYWAFVRGGWVHILSSDRAGQRLISFRIDELRP